MNVLSVIGLIIAMFLLVFLAMKGIHVLAIALICSIILAATSGMNVWTVLTENYMPGFSSFITANFLVFLAGALFGKFMNDSHAADAIANWIVKKLGASKAVLAVVLSCFVLCYGGVSVFVVGFTIFPIAISLFKEADLPRNMLPATIGFGSDHICDDLSWYTADSEYHSNSDIGNNNNVRCGDRYYCRYLHVYCRLYLAESDD